MALATRNLVGDIRVDGKDAENIGSDEYIHESRLIDRVLLENQDTLIVEHYRWGGECRVEVDLHAKVHPKASLDSAIEIWGQTRFYEGDSEDTSDREDLKDFRFFVPRSVGLAPPVFFQVQMFNHEVVGLDDWATVTFSLRNKQGPETE